MLGLSEADTILVALSVLFLVNGFAVLQFWRDKQAAKIGDWRIPEMSLLTTSALGGFVGAKLGQRVFRHKTRKQPFATLLNLTGLLNLGILAIVGGLWTGWLTLPKL